MGPLRSMSEAHRKRRSSQQAGGDDESGGSSAVRGVKRARFTVAIFSVHVRHFSNHAMVRVMRHVTITLGVIVVPSLAGNRLIKPEVPPAVRVIKAADV